MLQRVDAETERVRALHRARCRRMRAVHSRMLKDALVGLSTDRLREEVAQMQAAMNASLLNLGAKKAFVALCERLRAPAGRGAAAQAVEIRDMLGASFAKLNAEFGFSLRAGHGARPGPLHRRTRPDRDATTCSTSA